MLSDQIRHRAYRVFMIIMVYFSFKLTLDALLFMSKPVTKCCMYHSIIIHLPYKTSAICTDNLSCLLHEADPQYVWQVVDVHGSDAFCLQETVFGFRSYRMKKYLLAAIWNQSMSRLYPPCSLSSVECVGLFTAIDEVFGNVTMYAPTQSVCKSESGSGNTETLAPASLIVSNRRCRSALSMFTSLAVFFGAT